jgi:predicted nicotinamide N-methyase
MMPLQAPIPPDPPNLSASPTLRVASAPSVSSVVVLRLLATLRHRMAACYPLRDLTLTLPGAAHPYVIALPADPNAPLDRYAAILHEPSDSSPPPEAPSGTSAATVARHAVVTGRHMPYWGLLWPSGLALAEALLADPAAARARRTLELGCGLGLTAAAALACGARLIAADTFAEALLFTRHNALRNTDAIPLTRLLDWRTAPGRDACRAAAPFDLLLAADVLYEQDDLAPLLALAPALLAPGGPFWLAEPGRRVARAFIAAAYAAGWRDDPTVYERAWPPDGDTVRVVVHRFTLPGA